MGDTFFCARLGLNLYKGYNPQSIMGVATVFFLLINLETQQKFASTYRKANTFIKILKMHGILYKKKHFFCCAFNDKIVTTVLLASLTAFLWFS